MPLARSMRRVRVPLRWRLASFALGMLVIVAVPIFAGLAAHVIWGWIAFGWGLGR